MGTCRLGKEYGQYSKRHGNPTEDFIVGEDKMGLALLNRSLQLICGGQDAGDGGGKQQAEQFGNGYSNAGMRGWRHHLNIPVEMDRSGWISITFWRYKQEDLPIN